MYRCWECQHPKPFSAAQGVIAWPSSCGGKGTIIELAFHCSSPPMGPQLRMGHAKPTLEVMKKGKVLKIGLQYVPVCYSMLQWISSLMLFVCLYFFLFRVRVHRSGNLECEAASSIRSAVISMLVFVEAPSHQLPANKVARDRRLCETHALWGESTSYESI